MKQRWMMTTVAMATLGALAGAYAAETEAPPMFRLGADLRLRQERFDHYPAGPQGENDYFRIRPRVWSELDLGSHITLRARAVNEFRHWNEPDVDGRPQVATSEWPDEVVFDHLYVDIHNLLDGKLNLRVGRQDLIYGTGKVMLEGSPEDGSRTIYFNAIKASLKIGTATIDAFGIYNPAEDDLAIHPTDNRDLTGYTSAMDDMDESAAGVYVTCKKMPKCPVELYAIYKNESDWSKGPATARVDIAALDLGTVGARIAPKFNDVLSANLELAAQMGERGNQDVSGYMADASLFAKACAWLTADVGAYYLSGDDPATGDDEGWNPLFARYPQLSELYVFFFARGRWSNVIAPNAGLVCKPLSKLTVTTRVNYLLADQEDGTGDGDERGWIYVAKAQFTLGEKLLCQKDKLSGHLWAEVLDPGDYHTSDDTAYFLRWEFLYEF